MARPPFRCADAARDRADPLWGTAPQTLRWLLIEHHGPWRPEAPAGSGLPPELLARLQTAAAAYQGRILLIRRPGRQRRSRHRRWAITAVGAGTVWGSWSHPDELAEVAELLARPQPPIASVDPLLLVCTHGVHDVCCALRGRPVAAALQTEWPAATWECSHVGGDRFAANLVVLPDGVYYGNLDAAHAPITVRNHLAGRVDVDHLRGFSRFPPVVQVAVAEVLKRVGPRPISALDASARQVAPNRWTVDVLVAGQPTEPVTVTTSSRPPARLTCHAPRPTSAVGYEVTTLGD